MHHQILAPRFHDLQQNLDRLLAVVALVIRSMQVIGFINEQVWKNVTFNYGEDHRFQRHAISRRAGLNAMGYTMMPPPNCSITSSPRWSSS